MELRAIANQNNRGMDLETALRVPMWAHHVRVSGGEKVPGEITRCNIQWLTLEKWSQSTLPDFFSKLPRLRYLEARNASKLRKRGEDQLVLPLPNGTYEIFKERFADPPLTDEHGTYVGRVQIVRREVRHR